MQLSYLVPPAVVVLLCILEIYRTQGTCILGKNGGYYSQIRIVSLNTQDHVPDEGLLEEIERICETDLRLDTLTKRLSYQYTYTKETQTEVV